MIRSPIRHSCLNLYLTVRAFGRYHGHVTDVHDQSNFPRPGRHRSPDDWDDDYRDAPAAYAADHRDHREYDDYDDDFRDDERPTDTGGGMPLRGLAMICIFIGVCLMGWGLYAWSTGNDGAGNDGSGDDGTVAEAPAGQRPDMNPDAGADGRPDAEAPGPGADEDADADGEHPEINRGDFHITVLNNSEEPGLAARVSDDLTREGWGRGETGNAAEGEAGVWERTTVHYTPDNDAEKAAAEDIAHANGWDVAPRDDRLANAPGGIVVVTAIDANR